jgi:hypothetical protein
MSVDIPKARYFANGSLTNRAIVYPRYAIKRYAERRKNAQIKPSSSTITEKIKSPSTSGRYQNFWIDFPNPSPKNPHDPIAMSHCLICQSLSSVVFLEKRVSFFWKKLSIRVEM